MKNIGWKWLEYGTYGIVWGFIFEKETVGVFKGVRQTFLHLLTSSLERWMLRCKPLTHAHAESSKCWIHRTTCKLPFFLLIKSAFGWHHRYIQHDNFPRQEDCWCQLAAYPESALQSLKGSHSLLIQLKTGISCINSHHCGKQQAPHTFPLELHLKLTSTSLFPNATP